MKNLTIYLAIIGLLAFAQVATSAPTTIYQRNIMPEADSFYEMGTSTRAWLRINTDELCLTGDSCQTTWPGGASAVNDWGGFTTYWGEKSLTTSTTYPVAVSQLYAPLLSGSSTIGILTVTSSLSSPSITLNGDTRTSWPTGSGGTSWITATNYNETVFATNTPVWFQDNVYASSSLHATYTSSTLLTINGISWLQNTLPQSNNTYSLGAYGSAFSNIYSSTTIFATNVSSTLLTVAGTAWSQTILPSTNNTYDLGSFDLSFKDTYSSGTVYANEICFPNGSGCLSAPINEGSAVVMYPWNQNADIAGYEGFRTVPTTTAEVQESCSVSSGANGGYCATPEIYISTTSVSESGNISLTQIPAGTWTLESYTYVNNTGGNTKLEYTVFKRTALGVETQLFQATSTDINLTAVGLIETQTSQPAFSINPTDRLAMKIQFWTDSGVARTLYWVYQGTAHSSHLMTPITVASRAFASLTANNTFTGLNTFTGASSFGQITTSNASSTLLSVTSNAWFGGTATSTFNSSGALTMAGNILPNANNTLDLGAYGTAWKDLYVSSTAYLGGAAGVDQLVVGSSTPYLKVDSSGNTSLTGQTTVNVNAKSFILNGGSYDSNIYGSIDDGLQIGVDYHNNTGYNNNLLLVQQTYIGRDFDHDTASTNPTFFIHSATDPNTNNTQWISFTHNTLNGLITTGLGSILLSPASNVGIGLTVPTDKLTVNGNIRVGNGTVSSTLGVDFLSIATSTSNMNGLFYVDSSGNMSASGTLRLANNLIPNYFYPAFTTPVTSTWTGTTTIALGPAFIAQTWEQVQCFTDVGTLNVRFGDGTNWTELLNASTTVGTFNLTTNNSFTAGEKRYVDVGTPATAPRYVSCTVKKKY